MQILIPFRLDGGAIGAFIAVAARQLGGLGAAGAWPCPWWWP